MDSYATPLGLAHDVNGTLIVIGTQYRPHSSNTYGRMTLVSATGKVKQDYFFSHGASDHDELRDIAMMPNGLQALAVGRTGNEIWLAAIDLGTGIVLWDRSVAIGAKAGANAISMSEDGSFAITGTTEDSGGTDVMVARFKPDGTLWWARACGGKGMDKGYAISASPYGGLMIGGATESKYGAKAGIVDGWIFGLDEKGYVLWEFLNDQRPVMKLSKGEKGRLLLLDSDWMLFDARLEPISNPFFKLNWRGENTWTANSNFGGQENPTIAGIRDPALTCREIGTMNFTDRRIHGGPHH